MDRPRYGCEWHDRDVHIEVDEHEIVQIIQET